MKWQIYVLLGVLIMSSAIATLERNSSSTTKRIVLIDDKTRSTEIDLTLVTPLKNVVSPGEEVLVAEFQLNEINTTRKLLFDDIDFYNKRKNNVPVLRLPTIKYGIDYTERQCENTTGKEMCVDVKLTNWTKFSNITQLTTSIENKDVKVGLFAKATPGDYIEWVPTIDNVRIEEWASWSVLNITYVQNVTIAGLNSFKGFFFTDNGSYLYAVGASSNNIRQLNLSQPWNISTRVATGVYNIPTSPDGCLAPSPTGIRFNDDGTNVYISASACRTVSMYILSIPWNTSTSSFNEFFNVSSWQTSIMGLEFSSDGSKMYVIGDAANKIHQFSLSTPWNVTTATYSGSVSTYDSSPSGMFFRDNGLTVYVTGDLQNRLYEYHLREAWNINTSIEVATFNISETTNPSEVFFNVNGSKMYISEHVNSLLFEYNVEPTTYLSGLSVSHFCRASACFGSFSWLTSQIANTSVDCGTTLALGLRTGNTSDAYTHNIDSAPLLSNTFYYYNATSCDYLGYCTTLQGNFTTGGLKVRTYFTGANKIVFTGSNKMVFT